MKKIILGLLIFTLFLPLSDVQARKKVSEIQVKGQEVIDQGSDFVQVRWTKIKNTRVKFSQVKVQRKTTAGKYKLVKRVKTKRRTIRKKKVTGLTPETKYYFRVRACRTKSNCGLWSKRVNATTDQETESPDEEEEGDEEGDEEDENEFVIKNLIVDFAPYDETTGRAGAFIFHGSLERVFFEFVYTDGEITLPTFEYIVADDANVYSPIDGVVNAIEWQEASEDYEVSINIDDNPYQLTAGLDHVLNVQVSEGDTVTAGDVIGNPGTHSSEGYGRVEIEIYGDNYMHCPFEFFDPTTIDEYEQKVSQLMSDWETFAYDDTVYDEASMADYAAGCNAWKY